jgi:hypothetical protein
MPCGQQVEAAVALCAVPVAQCAVLLVALCLAAVLFVARCAVLVVALCVVVAGGLVAVAVLFLASALKVEAAAGQKARVLDLLVAVFLIVVARRFG